MPRWRKHWYPPSTPREAKGGIKAKSRRGAFATTWWGERWIAVLESFDLGARLGRGRAYARKGQVVGLEIGAGTVAAAVQGSRRRPYSVAIAVAPIAAKHWKKLAARVSADMAIAAKLLAGEMPPAIEAAFAAAGVPLFPARASDLRTDCSCPDRSNPCKHIAAVYYLLAEEFDRDPFLLFRLRGMERGDFVALLGIGFDADGDGNGEQAEKDEAAPEPLPANPEAFWSGPEEDLLAAVIVPPRSAPLAAGLGGFPFWRGEEDFLTVVCDLCDRASRSGLRVFLGNADAGDEEPGMEAEKPRPIRKTPPPLGKTSPRAKSPPEPAAPVTRSGHLVCLECGGRFVRLARHLGSAHGLTPAGYREKWALPANAPLVAPTHGDKKSRSKRTAKRGTRTAP